MKFDRIQTNSIQNLIREHTSMKKMQVNMNATNKHIKHKLI
jgi:hypothetical protein